MDLDLEIRREAPELVEPVVDKASGNDDKALPLAEAAVVAEAQQEADDLDGLSESHVVRDDAAEAEAGVLVEPAVALGLVGAELCLELGGHCDVALLAEALHELPHAPVEVDLVAAELLLERGAEDGGLGDLGGLLEVAPELLHLALVDEHELVADLDEPARAVREVHELLLGEDLVAYRDLPVKVKELAHAEARVLPEAEVGLLEILVARGDRRDGLGVIDARELLRELDGDACGAGKKRSGCGGEAQHLLTALDGSNGFAGLRLEAGGERDIAEEPRLPEGDELHVCGNGLLEGEALCGRFPLPARRAISGVICLLPVL